MNKSTTGQLIESLYEFVKREFKSLHLEIHETKKDLGEKIDMVKGYVSGHEGRISTLEDSIRVVKTKLGYK